MVDIKLSNIQSNHLHHTNSHSNTKNEYRDLEKSANLIESHHESIYQPSYSPPRHLTRKLIAYLIVESIISLAIYLNYTNIAITTSTTLIGPTLLGASTAALAQSFNQFIRKKFSFNRICKFIVWGSINGCFTVLWIDLLINQIDNLIIRIITDQLIGAPIFQMVFNILNTLWDNGEITSSIRTTYLKSLKYSYCFWPFFSIISFMLIPQSMIFPASCLANLIWNSILSKLS